MLKAKSHRHRKLSIETLEARRVLASLPLGADIADTGEYMLGRVAVTPVFLESDGSIDPNTENWDIDSINRVMANIEEGLQWWTDLLATKSTIHTLEWVIDRTFVDNRIPTPYEPISRISNAYAQWIPHFLGSVGYGSSPSLETNIRSFNHDQRLKHNTDWSFTIFVVNSENDADGNFAPGGSFSRAFAFAGGLFQVIPSTRPASTYAHETGHMFWARDEYPGSGNYNQKRGYYNAQNTNAIDANPEIGFVQEPSIMSSNYSLDMAWLNLITADSTLAQIGWRDSDGDGIFDVLDVPLSLEGTGRRDATGNFYEFTGRAAAQAFPNRNSFGTQNDITLNRVDQVEYRLDDGPWTTIRSPQTPIANLNFRVPINATNQSIEIRALDTRVGIYSNVFKASLNNAPERAVESGLYGFAWRDQNRDAQWDPSEIVIADALVSLVDSSGNPLQLQQKIATDELPAGLIHTPVLGVRLEAVGTEADGRIGVIHPADGSGAHFRSFNYIGTPVDSFAGDSFQLRANFDSPQRQVSIDAIATSASANVRFEAFDADGNFVQRVEAKSLILGQRTTLSLGSTSGNIAYVIARTFGSSSSRFDNIVFGNSVSTRTASDGSYSFPYLAPGTYNVQITPKQPTLQPSIGTSSTQIVTVQNTANTLRADFSFYATPSLWRNPRTPEDVNGDGSVGPIDALMIINKINQDGSRPLTTEDVSTQQFLDPDGDGHIGPLDALTVINYINANGLVLTTSATDTNSDAPSLAGEGLNSFSLATASLATASLATAQNPTLVNDTSVQPLSVTTFAAASKPTQLPNSEAQPTPLDISVNTDNRFVPAMLPSLPKQESVATNIQPTSTRAAEIADVLNNPASKSMGQDIEYQLADATEDSEERDREDQDSQDSNLMSEDDVLSSAIESIARWSIRRLLARS